MTCAIFATATGIVGAVVTLMGLLAMPSMMKAGYDTKMAAGAITAGGCLGILIPPSVLLIVYGATAGVSVVQLYAGAFFPGLMLTGMYIAYIMIRAKINPKCAPPLSEEDRKVPLSPVLDSLKRTYGSSRAVSALVNGLKGRREGNLTGGQVAGQLFVAMLPAIFAAFILGLVYSSLTAPKEAAFDTSGLVSFGSEYQGSSSSNYDFGFDEPAGAETSEVAPALEEPAAPLKPLPKKPSHSQPHEFLDFFADRGGCAGLLLRASKLRTSRSFQNVANLILPSGHFDSGRAGQHCVWAGNTF